MASVEKNSDGGLIERCREGDLGAFEKLYQIHSPCVVTYLLRGGFVSDDCADLTCEVFQRAYQSLDNYDSARGSFGLWLWAIVRDVARRNWPRRRGAENFDPQLAEDVFASAIIGTNESDDTRNETSTIDGCVQALPDELRRIIHLRYIQGHTVCGIAQAADIAESAVNLKLAEAHEMLKQCLKEKGFFV